MVTNTWSLRGQCILYLDKVGMRQSLEQAEGCRMGQVSLARQDVGGAWKEALLEEDQGTPLQRSRGSPRSYRSRL